MRKIIWVVMLLMVLCGCSAKKQARETVSDAAVPVDSHWSEQAYELIYGLPENAVPAWENETETCHISSDGQMEISGTKFLCSDMDSAVKKLSGFSALKVRGMKLQRFDLPEYRFSWCSQTESGGRVFTADAVIDGIYCYAIVCSVPEECGTAYDEDVRNVLSSFGLFYDENV